MENGRRDWIKLILNGLLPVIIRKSYGTNDAEIRELLKFLFNKDNSTFSWGLERICRGGKWDTFPSVLRKRNLMSLWDVFDLR